MRLDEAQLYLRNELNRAVDQIARLGPVDDIRAHFIHRLDSDRLDLRLSTRFGGYSIDMDPMRQIIIDYRMTEQQIIDDALRHCQYRVAELFQGDPGRAQALRANEQRHRQEELMRQLAMNDLQMQNFVFVEQAQFAVFPHHNEAAKARAKELLQRNLSADQLKQFEKEGSFLVKGSDTGATYKITMKPSYGIHKLNKKGEIDTTYCFMPEGNLVIYDNMLAQKLALELFEKKALNVANIWNATWDVDAGEFEWERPRRYAGRYTINRALRFNEDEGAYLQTYPRAVHDGARGTGRTTRQLTEAPQGALFIVYNTNMKRYTLDLARSIDRHDIIVETIGESARYRRRGYSTRRYIVFDHDCQRQGPEQEEFYHWAQFNNTTLQP